MALVIALLITLVIPLVIPLVTLLVTSHERAFTRGRTNPSDSFQKLLGAGVRKDDSWALNRKAEAAVGPVCCNSRDASISSEGNNPDVEMIRGRPKSFRRVSDNAGRKGVSRVAKANHGR